MSEVRILLPYKVQNNISIHSDVVSGGIEKFCKHLLELVPGIIPVEISEEDRKNRKSQEILSKAVQKYKPDMVLSNYDERSFTSFFHDVHKVPTACILHVPIMRNIRYVNSLKNLNQFVSSGGHLYAVSSRQWNFLNDMSIRLNNEQLAKPRAYITPSFSEQFEIPDVEKKYSACTIGRTDVMKNPFWLHKKLKGSGIESLVQTNLGTYLINDKHDKYYFSNENWKEPQHTLRGLQYSEVMKNLQASSCYVSTCTEESWGITALEALARGVPLIIVCNKTMQHSSTSIAADASHYKLVNKDISQQELIKLIREFESIPFSERQKISKMTQEKHSKEAFIRQINNLISDRMSDKIETNTLTDFFV